VELTSPSTSNQQQQHSPKHSLPKQESPKQRSPRHNADDREENEIVDGAAVAADDTAAPDSRPQLYSVSPERSDSVGIDMAKRSRTPSPVALATLPKVVSPSSRAASPVLSSEQHNLAHSSSASKGLDVNLSEIRIVSEAPSVSLPPPIFNYSAPPSPATQSLSSHIQPAAAVGAAPKTPSSLSLAPFFDPWSSLPSLPGQLPAKRPEWWAFFNTKILVSSISCVLNANKGFI
jgi:hypothetical protein